ncbi:hypothetical protein PAPHI01_2506 [Pancytospora philotis]|nr:hypothetical protein PAPHI01_2506 [Pancytospora philotis]
MLEQVLLIASGFAHASASGSSETPVPSVLSQPDLVSFCAEYHRTSMPRINEFLLELQLLISSTELVFEEIIDKLKCEYQADAMELCYNDLKGAIDARDYLSQNAKRLEPALISPKALLSKYYALCLEAYRHYEVFKQDPRIAGLISNHESRLFVELEKAEMADILKLLEAVRGLSNFLLSRAVELSEVHEKRKGVDKGAVYRYSAEFNSDTFKSHAYVLKMLFEPLSILASSTNELALNVGPIFDIASQIETYNCEYNTLENSGFLCFDLRSKLQKCHKSLLTARDSLNQGKAEWWTDIQKAIKFAETAADKWSTFYMRYESVNRSVASNATRTNLQTSVASNPSVGDSNGAQDPLLKN